MFHAYNRLREQEAGGMIALRRQMELTIEEVLTAYYSIVRNKQELTALEFGLKISEEQVKVTSAQVEAGAGTRPLVLLALTNRNGWNSRVLQQKVLLQNAALELNRLLNRDLLLPFSVTDSIPTQFSGSLPELTKTAIDQNASVLLLRNNESILGYQVKELKSAHAPRLGLNASYGLSRSSSEGGFALYNFNQGPAIGLQFNWNLFNGRILNTQIKQANLFRLNASLLTEDGQNKVSSDVIQAYRIWESAIELRKLEEENFLLAKENSIILAERFKSGLDNILLVNEAQRNFQEAISRVTVARYAVKKAEITLMRLSGMLLK
jgi:outer membrane protein TolC